MRLVSITAIDRKLGIHVVSCVPQPALEDFGPLVDGLVIQLSFGGPTTAQIRELISGAPRHVPGGRLSALKGDRLTRAIPNG